MSLSIVLYHLFMCFGSTGYTLQAYKFKFPFRLGKFLNFIFVYLFCLSLNFFWGDSVYANVVYLLFLLHVSYQFYNSFDSFINPLPSMYFTIWFSQLSSIFPAAPKVAFFPMISLVFFFILFSKLYQFIFPL